MNAINQNMNFLLSAIDTPNSMTSRQELFNYDYSKQVDLCLYNNDRLQIDISACTQQELALFDNLRVLLQGEEVYKKFGSGTTFAQKPFDPFEKGVGPE